MIEPYYPGHSSLGDTDILDLRRRLAVAESSAMAWAQESLRLQEERDQASDEAELARLERDEAKDQLQAALERLRRVVTQ